MPYELFAISIRLGEVLGECNDLDRGQLYYGIMYNGISALSLMGDNLYGSAYPLCRGAIELYPKLLILNMHTEAYDRYDMFREFEIEQSCCSQEYPEKFIERN